ncbi:Tex family protein [Fibrobacter intestinalis]|uniref:Tex family protein n=1 Tax=Fibrobacter intestinalis TaxID=28122 RepID=UPI0023F1B6E0|nr:Tex family protein [Fibrobacter intestinalis]MDD7300130.1 Tex family protein [Fibrobacter intestinalis]
MNFSQVISEELKIEEWRVAKALELMDQGGTIPFIARYRKDQTGTLNEIELRDIQHRREYLQEIEERKTTILKSIEEQGKLTPELKSQIEACKDKTLLEDLYAPYKPKKRTRATIAKECGLEPLARIIMAQEETDNTPETIGLIYCSEEKGLADPKAAINGACDILAEELADNATYRQYLRAQIEKQGLMVSKVRKEFEKQETKFKNYYDFSEAVSKIPSHRMLALRRGEKEKVLRLSIDMPDAEFVSYLQNQVIRNESVWKPYLEEMCKDAWERLLKASLESEVRLLLKDKAEEEAFKVFSKNLQDVLLAPPAGHKAVLALDPGFRTGCKVAVLDKNGKFLDHGVIFPHEPQKRVAEAGDYIAALVEKYEVDLIAIGNGTASRETDAFVADMSHKFKGKKPARVIVSEAGASVYSASPLAIQEFPNEDVTTRGAISIGRRLQDPLAELVKVDPQSIGVGQYQHDVNQRELKKRLDEVVESCVNMVGVDLNTASAPLLTHVAGVSSALAENVVKYREENGAFNSREEVLKVKGFGPKAYEQSAGFLRIPGAENPLDCSAVHPENYGLVEKMAAKAGVPVKDLVGNASAIKSLSLEEFLSDTVGKHTLEDIFAELEKPSRDPRKEFRYAKFNDNIKSINDLVTGSWMEGVVTNVANFGAFVDIGVHQDGLVHVSEISDKFVDDAKTVLTVGDVVKVRILGVDAGQKRISLSMKQEQTDGVAGAGRNARNQRGGRPPRREVGIRPHATIADLKARLGGANPKSKPNVQTQNKLSSMLKKFKKGL